MPILYPQGGVITMPEEYRNIYKICRKSAGFTQEAAAERLGISVESLRPMRPASGYRLTR